MAVTGPARPATETQQESGLPAFVFTVAKSYDPLAWMRGADRFSSDAAVVVRDGSSQHPLLPDFAESVDPAVSFDGKKILFAGKIHSEDLWQIWEVSANGGAAKRITSGPGDCIRPFYLPEDRVVYARKVAGRFVIETAELAGGKPLVLTYTPANAIPADILRDGRILFEAGYPLGAESTPEIYTVYSDGSGVESYRCDHGVARYAGRQNQAGDIVFVSPQGLARFTSARAQQVHLSAPSGEYSGDIAETESGEWLASWRPTHSVPFRLMRWSKGSAQLQPLVEVPGANVIQPTLLAEQAVPNRHPSGLHDWPNANLLCLKAYTSKYAFAPGSIGSVRMYSRESDGKAKLLGTVPVEKDGSFFVQVPTEQPLQIELVDAAGNTLKREAGFFWMRRGEQRACVGCHAGPETAPENAVPMILLKSTTPADMTGAQSAAGGH
jgi:hypothetical protein